MSADVYLDPATGDLPASWRFANPTELILQRIRIRLETFFGEWILDQSKGLPIEDWRKFHQPPLDEVLALVRREVSTVPGVLRTDNPSIRIDSRGSRRRGVIVVEMDIRAPDNDSMRVRVDLFGSGLGSTETEGYDATNLTGRDVVDPNTSPMVVVELIAGTLG